MTACSSTQPISEYQLNITKPAIPKVWILLSQRAGDNAQLINLADALGWPYQTKKLTYNRLFRIPNLLLGASLIGVNRKQSDQLNPPWPDLVIACGRRSVPAARWVRNQSEGKTRLVHLGRPWAPLDLFDLIISTPQYQLPIKPNIVHNILPLNRVNPECLAEAAADWAPKLKDLPRPFIVLLVGGNSRPFVFDPTTAERLGHQASALARITKGSLLVTTGRRTSTMATEALFAAITCPAYYHRWDMEANPYLAYLALADSFVVTGDSASMLAEACATGKPVAIFDLPKRPDWRLRIIGFLQRRIEKRRQYKQQDWLAQAHGRLVELGLLTSIRDLSVYHRALKTRGLAYPLDESPGPIPSQVPNDMDRAIEAIRCLFNNPATH